MKGLIFLSILLALLTIQSVIAETTPVAVAEAPKEAPSTHWECNHAGRGNRTFDLIYHVTDKPVPCQVNYQTTESPGEIQVLWQAEIQRNYCEKMLIKRVEELKTQGWKCEPGAS